MFVGHFGLGLGAKKLDSRPSLGTLFLAAQLLDLLWPVFLLLGWETVHTGSGNNPLTNMVFDSYPYSHSLVCALGWSVLLGAVYFGIRKQGKTAILLGCLVFSHWVLDYITHTPDLPLSPWSQTKVGLGLWNSIPGTLLAESICYIGGILLYLSCTRARNIWGHISLWGLLILLAVFYTSSFFSPPPSNQQAMGWFGLVMWLLILWGYWIDQTRVVK